MIAEEKNRLIMWLTVCASAFLLLPLTALSQDHGSGGSHGSSGCGDVFGDLIHILRDDVTGQPILAQRWVEMPAELPGYGWGYCPIAVYHEDGEEHEFPFLPFSCEFDLTNPDDPEGAPLAVEEVNYFGRLNGGRTKERNHRMHFNEVISNIKQADSVMTDETGRLKLGFDCSKIGSDICLEFATVDSPMESMALYTRLMKYGHIATDPYEVDTWAHGDPKLLTPFNPALGIINFDAAKIKIESTDWDKLDNALGNLMPNTRFHEGVSNLEDCWDFSQAEKFTDVDLDGEWDAGEPFFDMNDNCVWDDDGTFKEPFEDLNGNGKFDGAEPFEDDPENPNCVRDEFVFLCANPEPLDEDDFMSAAVLLAAAASKTGFITVDLVQYMNRILKVTQRTDHTLATLNTLPALVRDCWEHDEDPFLPDWEPAPGDEVVYSETCMTYEADDSLPNYGDFPDVQELFVNFDPVLNYKRNKVKGKVDVILDNEMDGTWDTYSKQSLLDWVEFVNGEEFEETDVDGFVAAANDLLRAIEYVHNYSPPEHLQCVYRPEVCHFE